MADACPVTHGTSTEDRLGCPDADDDGWSDDGDAFVFDFTQWADGDSDGYGDNPAPASAPDDCPEVWGNSTLDSLGCLDSDGDGWSEASDSYPNDKLLWSDDDGDGYADQSGTDLSDDCPEVAGTSIWGLLGCIDTDGDGWADTEDEYPMDVSQWRDTDEDGYGDNAAGTDGDLCPLQEGYSAIDRLGCPDADEDGYSDPADAWTVDEGADAFPSDDSQWRDSDLDGFGDNPAPAKMADVCPVTHGTSTEDRFGCPDTDDDGWSDDGDAFVFDITQWADGDSDGYGDNPAPASAPDDCPGVWGNSTLDSLGCLDSDGDGWSETSDSYPNDKLLWSDDDGDGYADQSGTSLSDDCPEVAGTSIWSLLGCIDTDGDGWADTEDEYPLDVSQWRDTDEDGYGDNADGTDGDLCPLQEGYSAIDRLGCPDADEDGYSDPADAWTVDDGADAFPSDDSQWRDSDLDGFGDNPAPANMADVCPVTHGTSTEDRLGCPDTDDDGWSDDGDAFVFDITQWADGDSDGYGDNPAPASAPDDCPDVWGNSTLDSLGCLDSDGDGWSEASDSYPNDKLLWSDDDGDGYADQSGTALSDDCPEVAGTSIWGLLGCIDTDGDGWADTEDEYPLDVSQWRDTDEDGYGDNADGTDGDLCPLQEGYSTIDRLGCPDADEDGYSDPADAWTVDDGADAFPSDDSQWGDSDLDGFGDNPAPANMADACPVTHGTSTEDRLGCPDTDGDGWSDDGDAFMLDITQWADGDSDGYGDNPAPATAPDGCPDVWGNSTLDSLGCLDGDGDGWSEASDSHPNDKLLWSDDDGDGYAAQSGTALSDDCPEVAGTSTEDRLGCIDTDGDGWSDEADYYPADAERHVKSTLPMILLIAAIVAVTATLLILRRRSRRTTSHALGQPPIAPPPEPAPVQQALPRPAGGLPPGWTEEQWEYYGQEWLDDE